MHKTANREKYLLIKLARPFSLKKTILLIVKRGEQNALYSTFEEYRKDPQEFRKIFFEKVYKESIVRKQVERRSPGYNITPKTL